MSYCEACGKKCDGWLDTYTCKHCSLTLCMMCLDPHQEDCPYAKDADERNAGPAMLSLAEMKLKLPAKKWEAKCHEVACAFVKHKIVKGTPRYGHWRGPVHPGCTIDSFFRCWNTLGWVNHGWVEMPDGQICDPTRWVFEAVEPYIFLGKDSEKYYDVGGNIWRATQKRPVPKAKKGDPTIAFPTKKAVKEFVMTQLLKSDTKITLGQACWIANRPPNELFPYTEEIYLWLIKVKKAAYIPIDNRLLILGK